MHVFRLDERIESAIAKLEAQTADDLTYAEARLVMDFMLDPEGYSPSKAGREAIERLNEPDPFAILTDASTSADTEG